MKHASHPAILKRLKRAEGHLRTVIAMLEAEKPCLEVAQQLHAVDAAITNAKRQLIQDHIDHCLNEGEDHSHSPHELMSELRQLSKYL
jgi:DNA-binding FrmR family transcriptional regulator